MEAEGAAQPIQFGLGFCIGILKNMGINLTAKELKSPTVYLQKKHLIYYLN